MCVASSAGASVIQYGGEAKLYTQYYPEIPSVGEIDGGWNNGIVSGTFDTDTGELSLLARFIDSTSVDPNKTDWMQSPVTVSLSQLFSEQDYSEGPTFITDRPEYNAVVVSDLGKTLLTSNWAYYCFFSGQTDLSYVSLIWNAPGKLDGKILEFGLSASMHEVAQLAVETPEPTTLLLSLLAIPFYRQRKLGDLKCLHEF